MDAEQQPRTEQDELSKLETELGTSGSCDFGFRGIDLDAALEVGAVFDADSSAAKVTGDRAVFRNFDATPSIDIADKLARNNHFTGVNFRMELRCGADDKVMAVEGNRTLHDAVDLQVFRAGDLSFDLQARTQSRGRAGRRNC
jgi:hypothetical protein